MKKTAKVDPLETLQERGHVLEIREYGKLVRQYHDTNMERFLKVANELTLQHMETKPANGDSSWVVNLQVNRYTI